MDAPDAAEQTALRLIGEAALGARSALSLAGRGLETLPGALGTLSALTRLDLSGNRLVELPDWIGDLTELEELVLRGNQLVRLPAALCRLERLARLDAADNRLVEIPPGIARLPRLALFDLSGNRHLILPPPQVVELGSHAVLEYLRGHGNMTPDARTPTETAPQIPSGTVRPIEGAVAAEGAVGRETGLLPFDASLATQTQPVPGARLEGAVEQSERAEAGVDGPRRSRRAAAIGGSAFVLVVAGVLAASLSGASNPGPAAGPPPGASSGPALGPAVGPDAASASASGSASGLASAAGSGSATSARSTAAKKHSTTTAPTHAVAPVYPTAAPNVDLALNRPISGSSIMQTYAASNADDGNVDTYWESEDNAGFPQKLTVDLGQVTTVAKFVFSLPQQSDWNSRTETFTILGSTNGSSYFTVRGSATYTFNANSASDDAASVTVTATHVRYIELSFTATNGWPAAQIGELGIYS